MAKKVGLCQECGRTMYTNDMDLCKRCNTEFGAVVAAQQEEEDIEEDMPAMEELGMEEPVEAEQPEVEESLEKKE